MATELTTIPELDELTNLTEKTLLLAHPNIEGMDATSLNIESLVKYIKNALKPELDLIASRPKLVGYALVRYKYNKQGGGIEPGNYFKGIIQSSNKTTSGIHTISLSEEISPITHFITTYSNIAYIASNKNDGGFLEYDGTSNGDGKISTKPTKTIGVFVRNNNGLTDEPFQIAIWELPKI